MQLIVDKRFAWQAHNHRPPQRQSADNDRHVGTPQRGQSHRGPVELDRRRRLRIPHAGHARVGCEVTVGAAGQHHGLRPPGHDVGRLERSGIDRLRHAGEQPLGKAFPAHVGSVVVLADGDVAATACEINLEHALPFLLPLAGHSHEVAGGDAVAVSHLGMARVEMHPHERLLAGGQRDRLHEWVDLSLRKLSKRRRRHAHAAGDTPVSVAHATIRRNTFHERLPRANPVERHEPAEALRRGRREPGFHRLHCLGRQVSVGVALLREQSLGIEVHDGGVVLMHRLKGDAVGSGTHRCGDPFSHRLVTAVAENAPVESADHRPLTSRLDNNAFGKQRHGNRFERIAVEQRLPPRGSHIAGKRRHPRRLPVSHRLFRRHEGDREGRGRDKTRGDRTETDGG